MQTKCFGDMKKSILASRTKAEIILITVIIVLTIIILSLIILLTQPRDSDPMEMQAEIQICKSQTCTTEALTILNRINVDVNPCEDFYAFACGNVVPLSAKNLKYGPFTEIVEEFATNLEQKYREDILPSDHFLVGVEKKLYAACMNESSEIDAFKTLSDALIFAGGWPVVEGNKWNEGKFDFIQAMFTLRQMGYTHSVFLELRLVKDPKRNDEYIFQLSIPTVDDVHSKFFNTDETNGFMADVAIIFGAEIHRALGEMTQTLEFLLDLQWIQTKIDESEEEFDRIRIDEAQRKHGAINWLNYINQIAGVIPELTSEDYVLFPSVTSMDRWLSALIKAPKRLQANYLMWRVVEDNLSFVTAKLRSEKLKPKFILDEAQTRAEFCIEILRENFSPSPIDVMYLRERLPRAKVDKIKSLLGYLKAELKIVAKDIPWLSDEERVAVENKIGEVSIIVGAPGDYFDDEVFSGMNYSVIPGDFVSMLAQLRKNNLDYHYGLHRESSERTKLAWWKLLGDSSLHLISNDEIEISPTILQGFVFNENRPNYMNYATMGIAIKDILYNLLEASTGWAKEVKCNIKTEEVSNYVLHHSLTHMIATQVAYSAYKSWVKDHGVEPYLHPLDYNPEQLFWIAPGQIYCHYMDFVFNSKLHNGTYNNIIKEVINNNTQMIRDFNCGFHIENKCTLY